jgi:hypothetical protein
MPWGRCFDWQVHLRARNVNPATIDSYALKRSSEDSLAQVIP